jgi:transcription antitermination factor NusG
MPITELNVSTEEFNPIHTWYAVYTRHQHEKSVALGLTGKGLEVFLPLYTAVRRWKDRDKKLQLPLFPCYVFLRDPGAWWLRVLTTPGIHSVVGFAGRPSMIPTSEIEAVRKVVESPLRSEPHPYLKAGDRVRLRAGPLEGLEGILIQKKNILKLLVSIEMLHRSVAVEVDATIVEGIRGRQNHSFLPDDFAARN